jgi:hypothetical protein
MLKGQSFTAGFVFLGLLALGCKTQTQPPAPVPPTPSSKLTPAQSSNGNVAAQPAAPTAPEADDATLLANKTAQYAHEVGPLLNGKTGRPTTQPSVVQWIQPANAPPGTAAKANQPVTLAAAKLTEDSSVPLILPESADQIAPTPATTQPGAAVAVSTDEYEKKLQQLVRDYPRDLGAQLDYQLLRFVRQESTPDLAEVAQLSLEDRELLSALMDGLTNFRNTVRAQDNPMLSRKIQPLLEMADRLRSQTELNIPTIALCTRVDSFGVYKPLRWARFVALPDHDHEVIVYCEVANFTSIQNTQKMWETRLRQDLVLYTETGEKVWPDKPDDQLFVDLARNRRHDFFIPRKIALPASLAVGPYLLKMTLTDEQSHRLAEATTPLEIVAP